MSDSLLALAVDGVSRIHPIFYQYREVELGGWNPTNTKRPAVWFRKTRSGPKVLYTLPEAL